MKSEFKKWMMRMIKVLSYSLVDVRLRAKKFPYYFYVPSDDEIRLLGRGDFAKLIFNDKERMWVRITSVKGNNFEGVLDNVSFVVDLALGDKIKFQKKNIADITWK